MSGVPAVSVLLPVYNPGGYLGTSIESVLAQSFADFEFLIIDDCSTDGSRETIARYARRDSRVRAILHERNEGLAATLNEGLRVARSELVARMDHDDESLPERLRIQVDFMRAHPEVAVAGSFVYHMGATAADDRLVELPETTERIRQTLLSYNCLYHPSVILRRMPVLELGGYRAEFRNGEDYDLWLRVSKRYEVVNIARPLLRYRFVPAGMTLSRKWEQLGYVYLAQAAHQREDDSVEDARELAQQMLVTTDRRYFMGEVAKGTVAELVALRMWWSAVVIAVQFARELGPRRAARLLGGIARSYAGSLSAWRDALPG